MASAENAMDESAEQVAPESQASDAGATPAPAGSQPEAEHEDTADTADQEQHSDASAAKDEKLQQQEVQQDQQQQAEQEQQQEQQEGEAAGNSMEEDAADAPAAKKHTAHTYSHKHTAGSRAAATTSPGRASRSKLTFTGPPNAGMAKPYVRADYSHSATKLLKIAHDNEVLVKKLTDISRQAPSWVAKAKEPLSATAALATGANASAAVNRRKASASIAQENHALYQRLVAIKPSKDISRETLNREHALNMEYMRRASNFKPGQVRATSTSPGRR